MKFTDLPLISPLQKALLQQDFTIATQIQAEVIPFALDKKDILWCAQTGSGKTLAFALPILQNIYKNNREAEIMYSEKLAKLDEKERKKAKKLNKKNIKKIQSLILAPTRELAIQIGESFAPFCTNTNLKHTVIYGGKNQFHQVKALEKWVDILIATSWRLIDLIEQWFIKLDSVEIFTLDEADKMLEMWFMEDVQKVIKLLPKQKQTLFFSATMPPKIKKLAEKILNQPEEITIERVAITAPDIKQEVYHIDQAQKRQLLQYLIKKEEYQSIIVFVKTKDDTETVLEYVKSAWIEADNMHRNRSQNARQRALRSLKDWVIKVLVATDLASRWIDIDNLSCVINYDLPQEEETYVHRIWRTARAGKKGIAISMCVPEQRIKLEKIEKLIWKTISVNNDINYKEEEVTKIFKTYSFKWGKQNPRNMSWKKKKYYWKR